MLDADNEVYPWCFERLLSVLDGNPGATFAYGMLERFTDAGPVGLASIYPRSPERFRSGNYIDAMAMIRTSALSELGGYRTDPRLYGWEDFDLWCRLAEAGATGVTSRRSSPATGPQSTRCCRSRTSRARTPRRSSPRRARP